jgi:DNA-binding transcriptional ArsR family regulator
MAVDNNFVLTKICDVVVESQALLAAIASPRRQEILRLLWEKELSAGDISRAMPDVTFGAISLQLSALKSAGLVDMRRDGRHRWYRARCEALGPLGQVLQKMWRDSLWRLKLLAELEQTRRGPRSGRPRSKRKPS